MKDTMIRGLIAFALGFGIMWSAWPALSQTVEPTGVWVLVKHVRFPIPDDKAIGHYPDYKSCRDAADYDADHAQWFTSYRCELRTGSGRRVVKPAGHGRRH